MCVLIVCVFFLFPCKIHRTCVENTDDCVIDKEMVRNTENKGFMHVQLPFENDGTRA